MKVLIERVSWCETRVTSDPRYSLGIACMLHVVSRQKCSVLFATIRYISNLDINETATIIVCYAPAIRQPRDSRPRMKAFELDVFSPWVSRVCYPC